MINMGISIGEIIIVIAMVILAYAGFGISGYPWNEGEICSKDWHCWALAFIVVFGFWSVRWWGVYLFKFLSITIG